MTSGLSVVIQGADGPYGVLGAHTRRQRHFSEDDGHYLQSLANIIGDFIKGQKAKEELQQALAFADALLESLPGIASLFDDAGTIRRWKNGVDAVRIAETYPNPIAMVITDVVMPGMNGREVVERVQQRWPGVRVLYMSGYTDDVVVNRGIQHHEVAFLEKPFAPDTLAIKVRAVLDEP